MRDEINRLVAPPPPDKRLPAAKNPAAMRQKTGLEREQSGKVAAKEATVQSTDGLFLFKVRIVAA